MTRIALRASVAIAALATMGCDWATKYAATVLLDDAPPRSYLGDSVYLTYAENTGGMLSLGANLPPLLNTLVFSVASGLALLALAVFAYRRRGDSLALVGLTLFIAGGASNWIDRVAGGGVVDFLVLRLGPLSTGIFNVADVAIFAGAGLFVLAEILPARRGPPSPARGGPGPGPRTGTAGELPQG